MNVIKDWGKVVISKDADGAFEVLLENSQLRVRYGRCFMANGPEWSESPPYENFIREFFIKSVNQDQIRDRESDRMINLIDAAAWRAEMTNVTVVCDDAEKITVRLDWDCYKWGKNAYEVSLIKDQPFLKIDYLDYFVNIVDIASPGGTNQGVYEIYGADRWIRPYTFYEKMYFDRCPNDIGYENMTEIEDPAPLNYRGWFIMGIYNPENGIGFGRVAPVADVDVIKLLFEDDKLGKRGFELFPHFHRAHEPFTCYLFAVTGGASGVLELGKKIADSQPVEE